MNSGGRAPADMGGEFTTHQHANDEDSQPMVSHILGLAKWRIQCTGDLWRLLERGGSLHDERPRTTGLYRKHVLAVHTPCVALGRALAAPPRRPR